MHIGEDVIACTTDDKSDGNVSENSDTIDESDSNDELG